MIKYGRWESVGQCRALSPTWRESGVTKDNVREDLLTRRSGHTNYRQNGRRQWELQTFFQTELETLVETSTLANT